MKAFRRILFSLVCIFAGLFLLSVIQVVVYRWLPLPRTPLMYIRAWENRKDNKFETHYQWTRLSKISSTMALAVIASEDNRFETHHGFDWIEIDKAIHQEKRKRQRGASTISQQVAKNVFLWPGRSWLRKGLEAYYTVLIETLWTKERIMEAYLNVAEMGKGLYGAEAAAQYYYKKPAARLTASEAAMLAACLPNPLKRSPNRPTPFLQQRQSTIMSLMRKVALPTFYK